MKILSIFGTRPEAIKMYPIIEEFKKYPEVEHIICVTGQHREMLDQVLNLFNIVPDYDFNIMKPNQTLADITTEILHQADTLIKQIKPDLVLVHGDTTTAYASALAAFYNGIKIGHVEAGLRSGNIHSPFPEEMNRICIDEMADILFAPTQKDKQNLKRQNVYVTGNTSIDVFKYTLKENYEFHNKQLNNLSGKNVLITAHRRENIGEKLENICNAISDLAQHYQDINFIYPVHMNPLIRTTVYKILDKIKNVLLCEPLDIMDMHNLMNQSSLILTDSGGIQEEAPYLGVPVMVLRDDTERNESTILVGTDRNSIYSKACQILDGNNHWIKFSPYGDGHAAERIIKRILGK